MVENPGKTLCAGAIKPVNMPETVPVAEGPSGLPVGVGSPRRQAVTAVEDRWRIDDEWWRSGPVTRCYYAVRLTSGQRLVIYKDLLDGQWYRQEY